MDIEVVKLDSKPHRVEDSVLKEALGRSRSWNFCLFAVALVVVGQLVLIRTVFGRYAAARRWSARSSAC